MWGSGCAGTVLASSNLLPASCISPYAVLRMELPKKESVVLSDVELVKTAREGDAASLGLLLERHRAPLYGLALRILGHGSQAQDAVHDTFLVALRKLDQVQRTRRRGGWLRAVLRNVCRMRLRTG